MAGTWRRDPYLWLALALTAGPAAWELLTWCDAPFAYAAADTFYYLTVARNIAEQGLVSFDQIHPTNGFHPLWQLLLSAGRLLGVGDRAFLSLSIWLSLALVTLTVWLLGRALFGAWRRIGPAFVLLPLGTYGLLVSPLWWTLSASEWQAQSRAEGPLPLYGSLWSFSNGMETGLVLAAYAGCLAHYVLGSPETTTRRALGFGALLSVLALARLDHALVSVALLGTLGLRAWLSGGWGLARNAACALLVLVAVLGTYLLVNRLYCGAALPTSGTLKSTFPHVHAENFDRLAAALQRFAGGGGRRLYSEVRLAQLLVPLFAAALAIPILLRARCAGGALCVSFRRPGDRLDEALLATAMAAVGLAAYTWLFVRGGHQGHWYFPVSILFVSLLTLRWADAWGFDGGPRLRPLAACLLGALVLLHFVKLNAPREYHARYRRFFDEEAPALRARYRGGPPRVLSFDDGIVAYALGFPTMNGMGLALHSEGVVAKKEGRLGDYALSLGFDHVASLVYIPLGRLRPKASQREIAQLLGRWWGRDANRQRYEVVHAGTPSGFGMVRVRGRDRGPTAQPSPP